MMENKILNEKESLALITEMIQHSQMKLKRGKGLPFLVFGYVTLAVSVLVYYLLVNTANSLYNLCWLAIPAVGFVLMAMLRKRNTGYARTYLDRIVRNVWWVIGSAIFFVSFSAGFIRIPVMPILILLLGAGTCITGSVIRFRAVVIGGAIGIAAFLALFFVSGYYQVLAYGLTVCLMMVIPGHYLNYKSHIQHV